MKSNSSSKLIPALLLLTLPVLLLAGLGVEYLPAGSAAFNAFRLVRNLAAAAVVLFLPGYFLLPFLIGKQPRPGFAFLATVIVVNLYANLALIAASIFLLGRPVNAAFHLAGTAAVAIVCAILAERAGRFPVLIPGGRYWKAAAAVTFAAGMIYTLTATRPGARPWPARDRLEFESAEFDPAPGTAEQIEIRADARWSPVGERLFRVLDGRADLYLVNTGEETVSYPLAMIFSAEGETQLEMRFNGWYLFHHYFPPPFDPDNHPRHWLPAREFFHRELTLEPGENLLEIHVRDRTGRAVSGPAPLQIWDYSAGGRREFAAGFRESFFLADTSRLYEFRIAEHGIANGFFPRQDAGDGVFFEGHKLDRRFRFFPHTQALLGEVLSGGDPIARSVISWLTLILALGALLEASGLNKRRPDPLVLFPAAAVGLFALWAAGGRIELTLLPAFLALAAVMSWHHLSRNDVWPFPAWGLACLLTPGGLVALTAGALGFGLVHRRWRRLAASAWPLLLPLFPFLFSLIKNPPAWPGAQPIAIGSSAALILAFAAIGSAGLVAAWPLPGGKNKKYYTVASFLAAVGLAIGWGIKSSGRGDAPPALLTASPLFFLLALPAFCALAAPAARPSRKLRPLLCLLPLLAAALMPWAKRTSFRIDFPVQLETRQQAAVMDFLLRRHREEGGRVNLILTQKMFYRFIRGQGEGIWPIYQRLAGEFREEMMIEEAAALFRQAHSLREAESRPDEETAPETRRIPPRGVISPSPVSPRPR